MANDWPSFERDGQTPDGTAIVLSGIQSTSLGVALGLLPALLPTHRKVVGFDYNVGSFRHPWRRIQEIADEVARYQRETGRVTIVGLSLGAYVAVVITCLMRVLRKRQGADEPGSMPSSLHATVDDPAKYRVIMIDPPFGAETMMSVPDWMAPIAHLVFTLAGMIVPSWVKIPGEPEVPSDEQLAMPTDEDRRVMFPWSSRSTYRDRAREADVANQKSHSFRTWFQQLAWLTGGALELPFETMAGVMVDLITAHSSHNTVVRTHLAAPELRQRIAFRREENVDAEHAGTLRYQPQYAAAMRELLN